MTVDPTKIRILFKTDKSEEAIAVVQKYKIARGRAQNGSSKKFLD
jgi:hypothetical protein